ncbi:FAD-dependent oxidoreductase [Actinokineospora sp. UTMC 2448]|uniref:flavin monoamine oxidase family protein n=1 Tax=Actinokineospora sp. UTMC 2448 TaxID=2268449 RepID=UPI0021646F21|nr:FAD-dependent oxidoreductase [Actinokineospora sp. UTMC 2448]UVS80053.1 Putrescine oxidase [Actinokineospora sp. UTMC 2448]
MKVVVIGAGLAGLTAARRLAGAGADVLVLESNDRVGGRAWTVRSALGSAVDLGGMWVGADHGRVRALAAEAGMTVFPSPTAGATAFVDGARVRRRLPVATAVPAGLALLRLAALSHRDGADRTVGAWLRRIPGKGARDLLATVLTEAMAEDPDAISMRTLLTGIRSAGGLRAVLGMRGGAQDGLLAGGAGGLAEWLAADLTVHLGRPATAITRSGPGIVVDTPSGPIRADRAVVAVPPPVARAIRHDPPLPPGRAAAERDTAMGAVYKAIAVYPDPFWRQAGFSGQLVAVRGPAAFDVSPPGGPGHLAVLVAGGEARALSALPARRRRAAVLDVLATAFGPQARSPVDWHEKSWHEDRHVGGGYSALPVLGAGPVIGPTPPAGPVHWAGTETAERHPGYLEGAVASGEAAADAVLT